MRNIYIYIDWSEIIDLIDKRWHDPIKSSREDREQSVWQLGSTRRKVNRRLSVTRIDSRSFDKDGEKKRERE